MSNHSHRNPVIDILKALASQIIVLHHLVLYTPMTPWLEQEMPALIGLIGNQARYVVQIFLVIGGFLAAQSLFRSLNTDPSRLFASAIVVTLWKRFLRLAKPFWVAIVAVLALTWFASQIAFQADTVSPPSLLQLVSHCVLLHDIVGVDALSAGVWYVAIDFQLFALFIGLAWVAHHLAARLHMRAELLMLALAALMTSVSLLWWNTKPQMDEWAWYFAGSYGLGVLALWAKQRQQRLPMTVFICGVLSLALILQMRERLILTGFTAMLLMYSDTLRTWAMKLHSPLIGWLSDISYSIFLIHYALAMLCSAVVIALNLHSFSAHALAFVLTWGLSIGAGSVLYKLVESR